MFFLSTAMLLVGGSLSISNGIITAIEKGNIGWLHSRNVSKDDLTYMSNANGKTLLHIGCEKGHFNIVEFLLDKGLDVNALDRDDKTPLHYAVISKSPCIVYLLLQKGAIESIKDIWGKTPVSIAKNFNDKGEDTVLYRILLPKNIVHGLNEESDAPLVKNFVYSESYCREHTKAKFLPNIFNEENSVVDCVGASSAVFLLSVFFLISFLALT